MRSRLAARAAKSSSSLATPRSPFPETVSSLVVPRFKHDF